MWKRNRWAALAGAILLTIALPVAIDQGYVRYNPYILPILGLVAVLLYIGFAVTSQILLQWMRSLYHKYCRRHRVIGLLLFVGIGVIIGGALGAVEWWAIQRSEEHVADLVKRDAKEKLLPEIHAPSLPHQAQTPNQPPVPRTEPTFKEIPREEKGRPNATFKEIPGPYTVVAGSNSFILSPKNTKENPSHLIKFGDVHALNAYVENDKVYVDAVLYGDSNTLVVEIKHNEFTSPPPQWDRNFDESALEIVDRDLVPRLQLIYKNPRTIVINGVYKYPGGLIIMTDKEMIINPPLPLRIANMKRLFKYPSRPYQGQEVTPP